MSYATQDDLVAAFGQDQLLLIADRDNDGVLDADVIQRQLDGAGSIVDGFVRSRYTLPLSPVDGVIRDIVCDLARTALFGKGTQVPQEVLDRDKVARALLLQIANGTMTLSAELVTSSSGPSQAQTAEISAECRQFTRDSLKAF
jgi:phage gp36-like protein